VTRNILVTGGAGYIGSHVCKILNENGFIPVTFDNLSSGHREFVKWGPFFKGDLMNQKDVMEVFEKYDFAAVMHFAAKAYVSESINNPIKYYRENVQGSLNLIEIFVKMKVEAFVFSSSCATYGDQNVTLIDENTPQLPINPYGFTKLAIERLLIDLSKIHNFNYSILRYFNAAGADQGLDIGEKHLDETHVIPLLISAASKNGVFRVYGSDYETVDGTAVRDYVHVSDLSIAHLRALEIMLNQQENIVCNVGTSVGISVLELVNRISRWKNDFEVLFEARRPGDPAQLVARNQLGKEKLGLDYKYSNIESIVDSAIKWHERSITIR
jgi:UDP-glucose-4-epimerase GalE